MFVNCLHYKTRIYSTTGPLGLQCGRFEKRTQRLLLPQSENTIKTLDMITFVSLVSKQASGIFLRIIHGVGHSD